MQNTAKEKFGDYLRARIGSVCTTTRDHPPWSLSQSVMRRRARADGIRHAGAVQAILNPVAYAESAISRAVSEKPERRL